MAHSRAGRIGAALRATGPDLLLGILAALGQAPWGLWPLSLIAMAALIWRVGHASRRLAAWRGMLAGIGYFGLALNWIVEPFLVEPEIYGWMAPFALILMAAGGGLFWALPAWVARPLAGPDPRAQAAGFAALLLLSDWLRGWIFTGFPWALLGHVWIDTLPAQLAAYIGAIGLSALTLLAATLPSLLRRPAIGAGLALLLILGAWGAGTARLNAPDPQDTDIRLRLVQPNAVQALKWDPQWAQVFFQRLVDYSATPADRPVDLVIWPETAVNFLLNQAEGIAPQLAQAAGAPLLIGIQRADGPRYYNSLAEITRDGQIGQVYDKFHLVPFGEYIPWGDQMARLGISAFAAQQGNGYSAGTGPHLLNLPDILPLQPLICYEAIFPQHLRGLEARPGWLLQVTNDSWFGLRSGPYQHLAQARLRAIETGLPLIRVANTGVSAVIDARGRVLDRMGLGEEGFIDADLPGALQPTPWLRFGPAPVLLATLLILAALLVRRLRRHGNASGLTEH